MYQLRGLRLPLWFALLFSLLLATVRAAEQPCDNEPKAKVEVNVGVGFGLALDYGTSAVYFPNNTYHTVAKIEGSPAYKNLMRELAKDGLAYIGSCWGYLDSEASWLSDPRHMIQRLPIPIPSPPWTGPKSQNQLALEGMISALKTSTESYIGTTVNSAIHVLPMSPVCHHERMLHVAMVNLGLHSTERRPWLNAYQAATYVNGLTECPSEEKDKYGWCPQTPELGLCVEYSRAALQLTAFGWEDRISEMLQVQQLPHLGGAATLSHRDADPHHSTSIREAIREFLKKTQTRTRRFDYPNDTTVLVLAGELGLDEQLREALRETLLIEHIPDKVGTGNSNTGTMFEEIVDPLFATAVAGAVLSRDERVDCSRPVERWSSWPDRSQANCMRVE